MMPPLTAQADTNTLGASSSLEDMIAAGVSPDHIWPQTTNAPRRRSIPHLPYTQPPPPGPEQERRMSMMEFGSDDDNLRGYQFHTTGPDSLADGLPTVYSHHLGNMSPMNMQQVPGFSNSMDNLSPASTDGMMNNMMNFSDLNVGQMQDFSVDAMMNSHFGSSMNSVMASNFPMVGMNPADNSLDSAAAKTSGPMRMDGGSDDHNDDDDDDDGMMSTPQPYSSNGLGPSRHAQQGNALSMTSPPSTGVAGTLAQKRDYYGVVPGHSQEASNANQFHRSSTTPLSNSLSTPRPTPPAPETTSIVPAQTAATPVSTITEPSETTTIYSKSGFDMIRALYYVSTRPEPEIQLGAVDFSCAFVVCDLSMPDIPIIYVSDNFQNLTGYSRHDIVGQNCRFLQAPDGKVESGTRREFVENDAVFNLKNKIRDGRECQQGLINYRKGGKPFLNLLTMIPIPWDTKEIRYYIGFQIDLVECPDAIAANKEFKTGSGTTFAVDYAHSGISQYIWTPPQSTPAGLENGHTLGPDEVSALLSQYKPGQSLTDWHKQSWDKMLLENTDDVVHVLSLKGLFMYLSPACKSILEYDPAELVGNPISSICHPSDIVPITRELKDTAVEKYVNIVFRVRRKNSGYTWFESHGSLFVEQGKGRKCIILVGRKRPVFALSRRDVAENGGIGDGELWSKLSTSGMYLFVSSNVRSILDLQPEALVGQSIQENMRKETRADFGLAIEKARRGKIVTCKHEVQNRRGQVIQATTVLYPGDASEGQKPTFLLAQTKIAKASTRALAPASPAGKSIALFSAAPPEDPTQPSHGSLASPAQTRTMPGMELAATGVVSAPRGGGLSLGSQDAALASDDNIFEELKTTRVSSWQFELRQMEKMNRLLAEELGTLLSNKKKRKRRKGVGNHVRDCANCHTRNTPEWRRGPSGQRDLCNSCGLRWAKQVSIFCTCFLASTTGSNTPCIAS